MTTKPTSGNNPWSVLLAALGLLVVLGLASAIGPRASGEALRATVVHSAGTKELLAAAGWEPARVARVVDGDTYDLVTGGQALRIRLLGVDAPEHDQAFGQQATDSVTALLLGKLVRVQRVKTDLYGRTLGHLYLPSPITRREVAVDSVLVVRGWAWAFDPEHPHALREPQMAAALAARRGLWKCGLDSTVPPKVWRHLNWQNKRRYAGGCTW